MSFRIAVIGAGLMGQDHARIVAQELGNAHLQVVCDRDSTRARTLAEAHGAHDIATDPNAVITRPDVDAVIIASPDDTHTPLSLACIAAGKKVLCEKPLSQDLGECLQVMAAEQARGVHFVQLGFMRRYDRAYQDMRSKVQQGKLGHLLMMHNFHRNVETPAADFTGAMAISNSAPHEFDIARHVLSCEFNAISAFQPKRSDARVAPVVMVLETRCGRLVTIEVNNNAAYGYDIRAEIIGEQGALSLLPPAYTRFDGQMRASSDYASDWRGHYYDAYRQQNRAFMTFLETDEFPELGASCWDGYATACIAEAGIKALATGRRTSIDTSPKPEFYQ